MNTAAQNLQTWWKVRGSKNIKKDVLSGVIVFFLALPLSLAISLASGFPPLAGIYTAVAGGLLTGLFGGAPLTIKGPAAGMIMICLGAVTELASTADPMLGVKRALAVGVIAACLQIILGWRKMANIGEIIPPSIVHGMMAAIGFTIMVKQFPFLFGLTYTAKGLIPQLQEIPSLLTHPNAIITTIALSLLALYVLLNRPKIKALKIFSVFPAPLIILLLGVALSITLNLNSDHLVSFLGHSDQLGPHFLIHLPENFFSQMLFPSFDAIGSFVFWKYVFLYTFIGSIESILTVNAMDHLDPWKRRTNLNQDLIATGIGNFVASMIGGLPMISEVVRSKANIDNGGSSFVANFTHGLCLLLMVSLLPGVLSYIPLAVLAALLTYTGYRLCSPVEVIKVLKIGGDQLLLFLFTAFMIIETDLLLGVIAGIALKFLIHYVRGVKPKQFLIMNILCEKKQDLNELHLWPKGCLLFTHYPRFKKMIDEKINDQTKIYFYEQHLDLLDHTMMEKLHQMHHAYENRFFIVPADNLHSFSEHSDVGTKIKKTSV